MAEESAPRPAPTRVSLAGALPSLRDVLIGMPLWGAAMLATAVAGLFDIDRSLSSKTTTICVIYFFGGAMAWPFILVFARALAVAGRPVARFCVSLISIAAGTSAMTAFLFSQQYRSYYAQWHEPFWTHDGMSELVETSASAVFQFLMLGMRLYFPLGIVFFVLASLWLTRRMR